MSAPLRSLHARIPHPLHDRTSAFTPVRPPPPPPPFSPQVCVPTSSPRAPLSPPDSTTPVYLFPSKPMSLVLPTSESLCVLHVSTFPVGSRPYFLPEPPGTPMRASSGPPESHVEPVGSGIRSFILPPGSCGHKHTGNPLMASVLCMIMSASRKQKPGGKGNGGRVEQGGSWVR